MGRPPGLFADTELRLLAWSPGALPELAGRLAFARSHLVGPGYAAARGGHREQAARSPNVADTRAQDGQYPGRCARGSCRRRWETAVIRDSMDRPAFTLVSAALCVELDCNTVFDASRGAMCPRCGNAVSYPLAAWL